MNSGPSSPFPCSTPAHSSYKPIHSQCVPVRCVVSLMPFGCSGRCVHDISTLRLPLGCGVSPTLSLVPPIVVQLGVARDNTGQVELGGLLFWAEVLIHYLALLSSRCLLWYPHLGWLSSQVSSCPLAGTSRRGSLGGVGGCLPSGSCCHNLHLFFHHLHQLCVLIFLLFFSQFGCNCL